MNTLWEVEEADREAAERARVAQWVAEHPDPVAAALARAEAAEVEVARLRAGVEVLHRPVHFVFSWSSGLRYEEPCPECHGKAGTHPCGCWAEEDMRFECLECALGPASGSRRVVLWPCPTAALLIEREGGASDADA